MDEIIDQRLNSGLRLKLLESRQKELEKICQKTKNIK